MTILIYAVNLFFRLFTYLIIARALMSWFVRNPYGNPIAMAVIRLTQPILMLSSRIMGRFAVAGSIDFSPIVAILIIELARKLIISLLVLL